jgi:dipeptidyl aminopeptidase/acylaminoacyl peptidase
MNTMKTKTMKKRNISILVLTAFVLASVPAVISAQGQPQDYERAAGLREKLLPLALDMVETSRWIGKTHRFWYKKSTEQGSAFFVADADARTKNTAFDHEKLAAALAGVLGEKVKPYDLPFRFIEFSEDEKSIEFTVGPSEYSCDLETYVCKRKGPARRWRRGGFDEWKRGPSSQAASPETKASPDGQWEAFIENYNVAVRSKESGEKFPLSHDGSEGNYYTYSSLAWSPDSKKIAAFRLRRGYHRIVHYVESSPSDQVQPKHHEMEYAKPGDALDIEQPVLFSIDGKKAVFIDSRLFPNPYEMSEPVWRKDSRAFTFEYNQRGHQVYRIIEVDGMTGQARALISEEPGTFFDYREKKYRYDIDDGREIVWMSERDGWNHLYLYDGSSGQVKNRITKGQWVVRQVDKVDEEKRQIYFQASGMNEGEDPYFVYAFRIDFDGQNLTLLTEGEGSHDVAYSSDLIYYVDTWSRIDLPPRSELRRTEGRGLVMEVEKTDISRLVEAGWKPPEVFTAKGRDSSTDIWGIIIRPMDFDPGKKYPVVEYIYAGPHSSHVPKTFNPCFRMQPVAEMGFIVVQIDGMGTSNRSKAFHDVCWKNLGDAGFPDRILWHKAVAAKYPTYDIGRVGIYGNSAGGQNALGGLLFHPEFYKVGVSSCGCHDNRMDKIWWNEQWMGWPLGPEYAASSNVDNAHRLQGQLLLILGEMDTNVDPSSTMQVVNALIKADKNFDLLVIPGGGHGMGGDYGQRKMFDFFVRHLHGVEPPNWNAARFDKEKQN